MAWVVLIRRPVVQLWLLVDTTWASSGMDGSSGVGWFLVVRSEFLLAGLSAVRSLLVVLAWLLRSGGCLQIKLYSQQLEESSKVHT